jgi:hypothetical protein
VQFIRKGAYYLRHVMRANSTTNDKKGNSTSNAKTKKSKITTQISSKDPDSSTLQPFNKLSSTHSHQRSNHSSHDSTIKVKTSNIKPYLIRSRLDLRLLLATKPLTHLTYRASLFFSLLLFLPELSARFISIKAGRWSVLPVHKSTVFDNTTEKRKKKKKKMENP